MSLSTPRWAVLPTDGADSCPGQSALQEAPWALPPQAYDVRVNVNISVCLRLASAYVVRVAAVLPSANSKQARVCVLFLRK